MCVCTHIQTYMRVYICMLACMLSRFSCVQFCATLWIVAHQAPLSMGFSRQEYWSGLPCPPPGDLPDPGVKPMSPVSPALQADSLPLSHQGSPCVYRFIYIHIFLHVNIYFILLIIFIYTHTHTCTSLVVTWSLSHSYIHTYICVHIYIYTGYTYIQWNISYKKE